MANGLISTQVYINGGLVNENVVLAVKVISMDCHQMTSQV